VGHLDLLRSGVGVGPVAAVAFLSWFGIVRRRGFRVDFRMRRGAPTRRRQNFSLRLADHRRVFSVFAPKSIFRKRERVVFLSPTTSER
jgi:hypothetical protein